VDGAPAQVLAAGLADGGLGTLLLAYGDGRAIQLNRYAALGPARGCRLDVFTDRGSAVVRLPHRLRWADAEGQFRPRPAKCRPVAQTLLEEFHGAVAAGRTPFPDLAHAYRLLAWWRLGRRSLQESRWVDVPGGADR
jgi:predicted dehydrogenase